MSNLVQETEVGSQSFRLNEPKQLCYLCVSEYHTFPSLFFLCFSNKLCFFVDHKFDCALFVDGPKSLFVSATGETVELSSVTRSCNCDANPKATTPGIGRVIPGQKWPVRT